MPAALWVRLWRKKLNKSVALYIAAFFGKRGKFKLLTSKLPALYWLAVPGTVQFNRPFRRV